LLLLPYKYRKYTGEYTYYKLLIFLSKLHFFFFAPWAYYTVFWGYYTVFYTLALSDSVVFFIPPKIAWNMYRWSISYRQKWSLAPATRLLLSFFISSHVVLSNSVIDRYFSARSLVSARRVGCTSRAAFLKLRGRREEPLRFTFLTGGRQVAAAVLLATWLVARSADSSADCISPRREIGRGGRDCLLQSVRPELVFRLLASEVSWLGLMVSWLLPDRLTAAPGTRNSLRAGSSKTEFSK
jgi:hypothetical protein